jgi:hypothetical protein
LRDDIIAMQKHNQGMAHSKRRRKEGELKVSCFHEDVEATHGSKIGWLCLRKKH